MGREGNGWRSWFLEEEVVEESVTRPGGWWAEEGGGTLAEGRAELELALVFYLRRFMSLT